MKELLSKALALLTSTALAVGLMPLPAFAVDLHVSALEAQAGTSDNPSFIAVNDTASSFVTRDTDDWYMFTTSGRHSTYSVQLTSRTTTGVTVRYELYDAYNNRIGNDGTSTTRTDKFLLESDANYKVKISAYSLEGANYDLLVTEIPSNPQHAPLGLDRNNPYALDLATSVNSQFTNRSGGQEQWYTFNTTSNHSSYSIKLFCRTSNVTVGYDLYDSYGDRIGHNSTDTTRTDTFLLTPGSTYTLKLSSNYSATSGYPSYELTVSEIPSNPQHASLGKDRNNPYELKLDTATESQFDDRTGRQEQWYTFTTGTKKLPTFITLTNQTKVGTVRYDLYDTYGNRISYNETGTKRTDTYSLGVNTGYVVKISGYYTGNSGFTSFSVKVFQKKPGTVKSLKAKAKTAYSITPKWGSSSNANMYELAYKKAGAKKWRKYTTSNRDYAVYGLKKKARYKFKVRGICNVGNTKYYGAWSKTATIKTKAR